MEEATIGHSRNQREWTVRFDFGEFPGPHIARAMPNTNSAQQVRQGHMAEFVVNLWGVWLEIESLN